ncbi:Dihydropteroate synthase [hydrothermal vent metagenome]|uniref:dihydropteroate synthase n=1 Tax=hydrothermal vent metagenome TaxID=652676 RepID=A0A1W1C9Z6_9ZZZZ
MSNKPKIMGVLNITPDSFSDGGLYHSKISAIDKAKLMLDNGVDIIDIGGESSRPNAKEVSIDEELSRVIPVIKSIRKFSDIPISIDTYKPKVMIEAVNNGATMINDIYAGQKKNAIETIAKLKVDVCLMHMQKQPQTMQISPKYNNVVKDVFNFLKERTETCIKNGINAEKITIDVGFGFGKTQQHNEELFKNLKYFKQLKYPILVGISKKSMIGNIIKQTNPQKRKTASLIANILAVKNGATIIRTHDVQETYEGIKILEALDG